MAKQSKSSFWGRSTVYWGRLAIAFFAILVAAMHLPYVSLGGSAGPHPGGSGPPLAMLLPIWLDIEVIVYTVIVVVYLFGMRTWYLPATVFNAFNLGIYLLSGVIAIPGITGGPYASHVSILSFSFMNILLMVSWVAVLVIGLLLLKYDPGSQLDGLIHANSAK